MPQEVRTEQQREHGDDRQRALLVEVNSVFTEVNTSPSGSY